jgi:L-aminopeptidase/D-esterase-like protein
VSAVRVDRKEDSRGWPWDLLLPALPARAALDFGRRGMTHLPSGFEVGHWTDTEGATGCTVVLTPPGGAVAGADVRGGGTGTRELALLDPIANAQAVHAVLLTGGSAFGLAAADGVVRWLEENGRGYETPGGVVPLVPAAVVYDLVSGDPRARPGAEQGYAACEAAGAELELGSVGAGTGAAVGKLFGRESAVKSGVGFAAQDLPQGPRLAVLAVVNAFGDVLAEDGSVLAGPRSEDGSFARTSQVLREQVIEPPSYRREASPGNTTLVCLMTDAELSKVGCGIVAKMAHAGMARAVDPVHSAVDGDVVFTLASSRAQAVEPLLVGVAAAGLTSEAIRDGCRQASSVAGIPSLRDH